MTVLTILGVLEILCSFRLVLEGKTGKEMPESSRLETGFYSIVTFVMKELNQRTIADKFSQKWNRGPTKHSIT